MSSVVEVITLGQPQCRNKVGSNVYVTQLLSGHTLWRSTLAKRFIKWAVRLRPGCKE
jgi:hypothetical protein